MAVQALVPLRALHHHQLQQHALGVGGGGGAGGGARGCGGGGCGCVAVLLPLCGGQDELRRGVEEGEVGAAGLTLITVWQLGGGGQGLGSRGGRVLRFVHSRCLTLLQTPNLSPPPPPYTP